MAGYKLEVTTGDMTNAGTFDHIYVTLIGTGGRSERTEMDNFGVDFKTGMTSIYTVKTCSSLGKLLLVKVEKDPFFFLPETQWYCSKIVVTTPEGDVILFPCYRWISRGELVELRGGRGLPLSKVFVQIFLLQFVAGAYHDKSFCFSFSRWEITDERLLHISNFKNISELPPEGCFSLSKTIEIQYVTEHWKEDDFYGYQFLNGINPNVIKKCSELPPNFPVTEEMVKPFLDKGSSLQKEMEKGNIFLYDLKRMDGLPTRVCDGELLHVTAGLCLFYMNPENKLMPIAIQLNQQPSEQNPIFLPSDTETDWLLAKMFIKNADSMLHQSVYHLMNTHYLAEVFTVSTLRSFPVVHPLYKLLFPHFRYTLQINIMARNHIFGPDGILSTVRIFNGLTELMRRALSETTYSSLCLPENITARGLKSIPNFYYRDDGLKLWNIINRFVKATVGYYYPSDKTVHKDTELQEWISEIFTHGFLGNKASGCPADFYTVEEVIKFITMVIFTVSAQHAAVNSGQFDYHSWVPNGSLLLCKPPPNTKGQSSMKTILETLPNVGHTVSIAAMLWVLSEMYTDVVPLGTYPEEQFDEPVPKQMINKFQAELSHLRGVITTRNSQLEVPYTYLNPTQIENSITI
uniref:Arachidonate 12-lipoxygenase, 12R-type-like n=1 Tax=Seriola dumerili TaxID=41447 RepID=A0A3B4V1N3_SERDU